MTDSGHVPAPEGAQGSPIGEDRAAGGAAGDLSGFDRAINDLHGRIADLRVSVDGLSEGGSAEGSYGPAPNPASYAEPPPYPQPATPAADQGQFAPPPPYAPPPPAYAPAYTEPPPPPASGGAPAYAEPTYAEPQYAEPTYAEPQYAEPQYAEPDVAYGTPVEGSDALGTFSRVDVGPFEDLLAMTAFEEQLSSLPSMADVRVRRFAARRAEIEIELAGATPLERELRRVAPDAETMLQPDGTLTVELRTPVPIVDEAEVGADAEEDRADRA
ncbi:MAG: hypothetical protein ACR2OC_02220 [Solirubrobacterales bacterium]